MLMSTMINPCAIQTCKKIGRIGKDLTLSNILFSIEKDTTLFQNHKVTFDT